MVNHNNTYKNLIYISPFIDRYIGVRRDNSVERFIGYSCVYMKAECFFIVSARLYDGVFI